MPHLILSSYELKTEDGFQYWGPPSPYVVGSIDARSLPECGQSVTAVPKTLFALSQNDSNVGGVYIGEFTRDTLDNHINRSIVDAVEDNLGLVRGTIVSDSPRAIIAEVLTQHADPTGLARWKPLLSDVIHLGGFSPIWRGTHWAKPGADPVWRNLALGVRQEDYRTIRAESLARGDEHYKRVLDYWREKYRLPAELFVPSDLPFEGIRPHQTTIGDTFTDTDGVDLDAHTATGPNGGFSWVLDAGTLEIQSNQLAPLNIAAFEIGRANSSLSSDDHYAQVDVPVLPSNNDTVGPVVRKAASATLTYYRGVYRESNQGELWKRVTGSFTQLGADFTSSPTTSIKVSADGSTIELFFDGASLGTRIDTDTALTGNLQTGVEFESSVTQNTRVDNFEAADLAAAATRRYSLTTLGVG